MESWVLCLRFRTCMYATTSSLTVLTYKEPLTQAKPNRLERKRKRKEGLKDSVVHISTKPMRLQYVFHTKKSNVNTFSGDHCVDWFIPHESSSVRENLFFAHEDRCAARCAEYYNTFNFFCTKWRVPQEMIQCFNSYAAHMPPQSGKMWCFKIHAIDRWTLWSSIWTPRNLITTQQILGFSFSFSFTIGFSLLETGYYKTWQC